MKNVLLLNGSKSFHHSNGQLNQTLVDTAEEFLKESGLNLKITNIDKGYNLLEEIEKILWADFVIYQMPAWWMGTPWIVKKYIDEVFTEGQGKLYTNDGRTRSDSSKKYGSGGLLQGKKYMISVTWNAPTNAFSEKDEFFEGVGVEGLYLHFHKANQFLGMSPLPTFMCNDVIKLPDVPTYLANLKEHLTKNIINS